MPEKINPNTPPHRPQKTKEDGPPRELLTGAENTQGFATDRFKTIAAACKETYRIFFHDPKHESSLKDRNIVKEKGTSNYRGINPGRQS